VNGAKALLAGAIDDQTEQIKSLQNASRIAMLRALNRGDPDPAPTRVMASSRRMAAARTHGVHIPQARRVRATSRGTFFLTRLMSGRPSARLVAAVKWLEKNAHGPAIAIPTKRNSVVISIAQEAEKCRNGS
jgi:hypothetical protein